MPPRKDHELSAQIQDLKDTLLGRLNSIEKSISHLDAKVNETTKIAIAASERAEELEERIKEGENEQSDIRDKHDQQNKRIEELEALLDDQINRSMRSTLVFKGIEGNERSWSETTAILAKTISSMERTITEEKVVAMVDRAHSLVKKTDKRDEANHNIVAK